MTRLVPSDISRVRQEIYSRVEFSVVKDQLSTSKEPGAKDVESIELCRRGDPPFSLATDTSMLRVLPSIELDYDCI